MIFGAVVFAALLWVICSAVGKGVGLRPENLLRQQVELYRASPRLDPYNPAAPPAVNTTPERAAFQGCAPGAWHEERRIAAPKTVFYRCRSAGQAVLARVYYPEDFSDPEIRFAHCSDAACPSEPAFPPLGRKTPTPPG